MSAGGVGDACDDPYEEWYAERSAGSAGTLVEQERECQAARRRQRDVDAELCARSLPREQYADLGPLGGGERVPKRAGQEERGESKRSRPVP